MPKSILSSSKQLLLTIVLSSISFLAISQNLITVPFNNGFVGNNTANNSSTIAYYTNPNRISGKGYGESKLLNDCGCEGTIKSTCTEAEHQLNRRTEFIIIKM